MSLVISRDDVKRKCMVAATDSTHNDAVDALIAEMAPAIEYTLDPVFLNNTDDEDLQALLSLGALELVAAEFLAQRAREPGFSEDMQVGGIRVGQAWERGKALYEQGTMRLAPFRKSFGPSQGESLIVASAPQERAFSRERWKEMAG